MRVKVYRNLNKKTLSVKDAKTNLVLGYADSIMLHDVKFQVSQNGRKRVIKTGHKNVHAYVIGEWDGNVESLMETKTNFNVSGPLEYPNAEVVIMRKDMDPVFYSPRITHDFHWITNNGQNDQVRSIRECDCAILSINTKYSIWVSNLKNGEWV